MNPSITSNDSKLYFMENNSKQLLGFHSNSSQQILLGLNKYKYNQCKNYKNTPKTVILEHASNFSNKRHTDEIYEGEIFICIDKLVPYFVKECLQNFLQIDPAFASYYLTLLIRDYQDCLQLNVSPLAIHVCEVEKFILSAIAKYKNSADPTVGCMKICFYCKQSKNLYLNFAKQKYDFDSNSKLKQLIDSILQYPETSSNTQVEEMFLKMQVFIIAKYQIGDPKNHVLVEQCRQSLNSILAKGDIKKYVLRKRYNRMAYLEKLGATAAGILIFNNQAPDGDNENLRNIFADLKMAECNTKYSIQQGLDRVFYLRQKGFEIISKLLQIIVPEEYISCLRPLTQIQELAKFVPLFEVYRTNLERAKTAFEKTQYLIEVDKRKYDLVVKKINAILKYRSAVESEKIFPHFIHLSEIWSSLVMYLNHIIEVNKLKDQVDDLLSEQMENKFNNILENLTDTSKNPKHALKYSFQDFINRAANGESKQTMLNIKPFAKHYCALTMALTGGILVPSQLEKRLCQNMNFYFGFANMEFAKFAENHFEDFLQAFQATILKCSDLIVLFELDEDIIQQDIDLNQSTQRKSKTLDTQTEMIPHKFSLEKQNEITWNIWDFHRQTIKLANIRKKQTHSTQSNLSYGLRNAQNQCEELSHKATHM